MSPSELDARLRSLIEQAVGFTPQSPKDFDRLLETIRQQTGMFIGQSTLMRYWGYVKKNKESDAPQSSLSRHSHDILSRMVGFVNWESFCTQQSKSAPAPDSTSHMFRKEIINTSRFQMGCSVRLMWKPDRCVTVRYLGQHTFCVTESQNSKLLVGDTFTCREMVDGEPLTVHNLLRTGMPPASYTCGHPDGVIVHVIN